MLDPRRAHHRILPRSDGLPDLLEQTIGSNPNDVDTDGDGLLDFDEFANFGQFFQNNFLFAGFFLTDVGSQQIGTSPISQDTDGDGLSDSFERLTGWRVLDLTEGNPPRDVMSSPLFADSDFDGLTDRQEYVGADGAPPGVPADTGDATDPTDPDTDGDGKTDADEIAAGTNPLIPDIIVDVRVTRISFESEDGQSGDWLFYIDGGLADEVPSTTTIINGGIIRTLYGLSGDPNACDGFAGGDFDAIETLSPDGDSVVDITYTQVMVPGDSLLLRWTIANDCASRCSSDGIFSVDFNTLNSTGWTRLEVDGAGNPTTNDACEGGSAIIEIFVR